MDLVKIEEMERELVDRGIIAPPEFGEDELRIKIMEIIVTEGKDSDLGRQIWQYCKIVEFDYEAIKPILDKDPNFFSQLEELGSMQFNFMLLQVKELKMIRSFLQNRGYEVAVENAIEEVSHTVVLKIMEHNKSIESGIINPDEWEKDSVIEARLKPYNIKEDVDFDSLMPKDE